MVKNADVVIIGAGAAGLMCALIAGQRGKNVLVLEHGKRPGRKILLSGGGRCNYTNMWAEPSNYMSGNEHYCKSALSRFTQWDFQALVDKHGIAWHEKTRGQLFCNHSSRDIVDMLLAECDLPHVNIVNKVDIGDVVATAENDFTVKTSLGTVRTEALVIATGGLSFPTMGATDFGYQIARQFGHTIVPLRPALVPLTLGQADLAHFADLAGISTEVVASCNGISFREALLITHKGLSGPAVLQISSYWQPGDEISINWLPDINVEEWLSELRTARPGAFLGGVLSQWLPKRLAIALAQLIGETQQVSQWSKASVQRIINRLTEFRLIPNGTEGYKKAEVTAGGVNTKELSSKTMASQKKKGLYFIGEVVDVTGWLGGFNFQWAWASGYCAGLFL